MAAMSNIKTFYAAAIVSLGLHVLLSLILQYTYFSYTLKFNLSTSCTTLINKLQNISSMSMGRRLDEASSPRCGNHTTRTTLKDCAKKEKDHATLPYMCQRQSLLSILLLQMFEAKYYSNRFKLLTKNDVLIQFELCNSFLTDVYEKVMEKLAFQLNKLAKKYYYPEREKALLWNRCKEGIQKSFKEVDEYYDIYSEYYMHKRVIFGVSFNRVLQRYIKMWKDVLQKNEDLWNDTFAQSVEEYKAKDKQMKKEQLESGTKVERKGVAEKGEAKKGAAKKGEAKKGETKKGEAKKGEAKNN
ncbi:hypothetical protein PVIIG_02959 [Plasmodium vivax India VII]|uniref:Plasmodium RESA N-terminal domain-containing protein n=1 Tax=Plasmodium vivax India VII TaxID=1077284 RepID=A0A0J9SFY2_PLAVI|nr:hypothetical protein PVIIG_02959 [Plasmodium vivax India VII]